VENDTGAFGEISLKRHQLPWDAQGSPQKTIGTRLQTLSVTSVFSFFSHHANRSLCIISSSVHACVRNCHFAKANCVSSHSLSECAAKLAASLFATNELKGEAVRITQCNGSLHKNVALSSLQLLLIRASAGRPISKTWDNRSRSCGNLAMT
jgi:hypothetical protein